MAREDDPDLVIEGGAKAPESRSGLVILIIDVVLLVRVSAIARLTLTGALAGGEASVSNLFLTGSVTQ